jgi:hypothetical protein
MSCLRRMPLYEELVLCVYLVLVNLVNIYNVFYYIIVA